MRTFVGVIAVLGLAVAVAGAQPPRERGATFRPPEPLSPGDLPTGPVARGASEEFPPSSFLPSTPVSRADKGAQGGRGPAWLSGVDPNVLPAAGSASKGANVRQLSPAPASLEPKDDPFIPPKGISDKLKNVGRAQPTTQPQAQPPQPTAETAYRGTGANGAPVYAGPPAYRWYGYGTVTPGANPFAPTGQYPRASANWYSITGATPGAFPVPVANPFRNPPGTEPPSYAAGKPAAPPAAVVTTSGPPAQAQTQPDPQVRPQPRPQPPVERPEPPKFNPTGESKFAPAPLPPMGTTPAAPVNVPKLTPPPSAPLAMAPVAPPVLPPVTPEPPVIPPAPKPEPVAVAPPVVPPPAPIVPPPVMPPVVPPPVFPSVEPAKPVTADVPSPLPISLMGEPKVEEPKPAAAPAVKPPEPRREEHNWQPATEPTHPAPGTWAPAAGVAPQPAPPATDAPAWKSGAAPVRPVVARAQMPDNAPNPVEALIKQMCQGRAESVDIRWAGTKKLMVCFEVRTPPEAQKLVTDISKRPELAPYQIDFCAVVKK